MACGVILYLSLRSSRLTHLPRTVERFSAAKITHLAQLPQGQAERDERARAMVAQMEAEGFGYCTNHGECQTVCPKGVSMDNIAFLNHDFRKAWLEALSSR